MLIVNNRVLSRKANVRIREYCQYFLSENWKERKIVKLNDFVRINVFEVILDWKWQLRFWHWRSSDSLADDIRNRLNGEKNFFRIFSMLTVNAIGWMSSPWVERFLSTAEKSAEIGRIWKFHFCPDCKVMVKSSVVDFHAIGLRPTNIFCQN